MRAFLLAGGIGSRLSPYTLTIPKPMLPVGNAPILEIVIQQLVSLGFDHITISLGHLPHLVKAHVENMSFSSKVKIEYVEEVTPLGTAGALSLVSAPTEKECVLVMNGDLLTDFNYAEMVNFHLENMADASIATTIRKTKIDYGVIEKNTIDSSLIKFTEKPELAHEICLGIYVLSKKAWAFLQESYVDMPQLLIDMNLNGDRVICYESNSYWQDIGNLEDYIRASSDYALNPMRFMHNV